MKLTKMKDTWLELLHQGGRLIFESGISSFKIVKTIDENNLEREGYERIGDWIFECTNPSHPVFSKESLESYLGPKVCAQFLNLHSTSDGIRFNERIIIPASSPSNPNQQESDYLPVSKQQLGAILKEKTLLTLKHVYELFFHSCDVTAHQDEEFTIHTSKLIMHWIQVSLK